MKLSLYLLTFLVPLFAPLSAGADGLMGKWATPGGAVVEVYSCGDQTVCAKLIQPIHPAAKDEKNPDASLRNQPLCGLQLGRQFVLTDPSHARDGKIYDPDSGKTYSGTMTIDKSELKLRGYVGVSLFGRTEVWHRPQQDVAACTP